MDGHWEGWIRPLLLIAVAGTVGALGWFGVIPDATSAWLALAVLLVAGGGVVLVRVAFPGVALWRRAATLGFVLASVAFAAWSPWQHHGDARVLVTAALADPAASLTIPPTESRRLALHVRGAAGVGKKRAPVRVVLTLGGPEGGVQAEEISLEGTRDAPDRAVWRPDIALSAGATVTLVEEDAKRRPRWPITLHLVDELPDPREHLPWAALVLLLAALLDGSARRGPPTWISYLVGSTLGFAAVHPQLWAPGGEARAVVFAALLGAVGGTIPAAALTALVRLVLRRPRRSPDGSA